MRHPYATDEPLDGPGGDAEQVEAGVPAPSARAVPPATTMTPTPAEPADGNDNAKTTHSSGRDDVATVVSHSSDVSSPSSSSSRSSAAFSSFTSASDSFSCSSGSADVTVDGSGAPTSGHQHHRREERRHRDHRRNLPRDCPDDGQAVRDNANVDVFASASPRVQTSEHTRFTTVLVGGKRRDGSAGPHTVPAASCGRVDGDAGGDSSPTQELAWWRSSAVAANTMIGAAPTATGEVHPYYCAPNISASPSVPQHCTADVDPAFRDVMPAPHAAAAQRHSATSPLLSTASATSIASPTPLPPTHPRRSSSLQSCASKVFSMHTAGGVARFSQPLFAGKHSRNGGASAGFSSPVPADGSVQMQSSRSTGCVTRPIQLRTLRRSFSFTSGLLPVPASSYEMFPCYAHRASSPITGANAATGAPRAWLSGERHHERTASIASSVHSASSSARPSVPLPPSHVGAASNMMAAVWVDVPLSQSGSRCATPMNSNGDAYPPPRRRRTTPRRRSGPPSPATSTLAASVASSLDGGGPPFSAPRLLVTVSTQTESDPAVVEGGATPTGLPRRLYTESSSGSPCATVVGGGGYSGDAAHQYNLNCSFESEGAAVAAAASVSSTSAEVSPRSLLASAADMRLDGDSNQLLLDGEAAWRGQQRTTVNNSAATAPSAPAPLSAEGAARLSDAVGGDSPSSPAAAEPTGAADAHQTLRVDALSPQEGAKAVAVTVSAPGLTAAEMSAPCGVRISPITLCFTPLAPPQEGIAPAASRQSQAAAPPPTATAGASTEAAAQSLRATAGEEQRSGAVGDKICVDCATTAPVGDSAEPSAPQSVTLSRSDEVRLLRAELAEMRLQYERVVQQLRQMQETAIAAGGATGITHPSDAVGAGQRPTAEVVLSATSPSLPAASRSSSSRSASIQNHSSAPEGPLVNSMSPVSSNSEDGGADATATLDHVRAALLRTRQRATQ
ncbi:hypothetical protein GH5_08377 [Leishmania sp. Ghana 2012 LV757]|uniref:hypothetical protein n=1 Tax=Leishmania sp. Ghana 2012 LV757 TaxID=2803181 RepID=UPI001B495943|nr:hypothetical protein GH5_08377 [Leishmania sp. Ghana 2012 LV757]